MSTKNLREQLGSALIIVLVIVGLAIIGGLAWYGLHRGKSVATTAAEVATQSACMKIYNDNTICNFAVSAASLTTSSYTATATTTTNGATSTLTIKSDGKGNSDITTGGEGQSTSFRTLNGNTYFEQPGGSWMEYPASSSPAPGTATNPASDIKFDFADDAKQSTFKKLGTEACGNLTCVKYQVTDPGTVGATYNIWIDTAKYQLQRWQSTTSDGSTVNMTFTYGSVTISTPSPVTTI